MVRLFVSAAVACAFAACGLIDESVDDFTLDLPEKEFNVDSSMWGLQGEGAFPSVACPAIDCAGMSSTFCSSSSCMPSCGSGGTCEVSTSITLYQMVNLAMDKPELAEIDHGPGIMVKIQDVFFMVEANTFPASYVLPELQVYVGPISAVDPTNAEAQRIGTIAPVVGGFTGMGMLEFVAGGREILESYMSDYKTPYNLIVAGTETVQAGDTIPMGMMLGKVTGTATADAI